MESEFDIKGKDAFLKKYKKKFETKSKDEDSLKSKGLDMKKLTTEIGNIPEKLNIVSVGEKPSARKQKPEENQLQGGKAKPMV